MLNIIIATVGTRNEALALLLLCMGKGANRTPATLLTSQSFLA